MEKKIEEKTVTATKSEKLAALQIALTMRELDITTISKEGKYISALINRAETILKWANNNYLDNNC